MSDSTSPSAHSQRVNLGTQENSHLDWQRSALQGASLAFRTLQPTAKPSSNYYSDPNAAARAAFVAEMGQQRAGIDSHNQRKLVVIPRPSANQLRMPPSAISGRNVAVGGVEDLEIPTRITSSQHQSPSYIAATVAAARSSPATPMLQEPQRSNPRRVISSYFPSTTPPSNTDDVVATKALIKLFESKDVSEGIRVKKKPPLLAQHVLPIASPTPIRPVQTRLSSRTPTWVDGQVFKSNGKSTHRYADPSQAFSQNDNKANSSTLSAYLPKLDISGKSRRTLGTSPESSPARHPQSYSSDISLLQNQRMERPKALSDGGNSSSSYTSAHDCPPGTLILATIKQEQIVDDDGRTPAASSTIVHHLRYTEPSLARSRSSLKLKSASRQRSLPGTSQLTVDTLADAIVASSLAASRASSPTKLGPPLPAKRHSKHLFPFRHDYGNDHATPREHSPAKVLRHTMRDLQRPEDEDERVRKSHVLKKHPNKHAEGDRKRWRDQITERERKRYEGLWAANRGLLIPATEPQDLVNNLVVRDIWERSQLSSTILAEVWDLVDSQGVGRLSREEFVVGMWLVDQCLKGRKLPVKVSESVWSSVRRLSGIKILETRR
ncbi:MAG: hypothetical protein Q9187_000930 [Circinaria calcarea]